MTAGVLWFLFPKHTGWAVPRASLCITLGTDVCLSLSETVRLITWGNCTVCLSLTTTEKGGIWFRCRSLPHAGYGLRPARPRTALAAAGNDCLRPSFRWERRPGESPPFGSIIPSCNRELRFFWGELVLITCHLCGNSGQVSRATHQSSGRGHRCEGASEMGRTGQVLSQAGDPCQGESESESGGGDDFMQLPPCTRRKRLSMGGAGGGPYRMGAGVGVREGHRQGKAMLAELIRWDSW